MKQTAVEWLEEQISDLVNPMPNGNRLIINKALKQAKEIEKQQQGYSKEDLKEAFQSGFTNGLNMDIVTFDDWFEQFKNKL